MSGSCRGSPETTKPSSTVSPTQSILGRQLFLPAGLVRNIYQGTFVGLPGVMQGTYTGSSATLRPSNNAYTRMTDSPPDLMSESLLRPGTELRRAPAGAP